MSDTLTAAPLGSGGRGFKRSLGLTVGAIGIVFGDIGTSPLYALRECFSPQHGIALHTETVLGIVSLLIWTLTLICCVKYLLIVLRADNHGDGGILALVSLVGGKLAKNNSRYAGLVATLGMLGAALLYSDGVITPAISVLSAVEGLENIAPHFEPFVLPIAIVVLAALFPLQSRGTAKVGRFFGPILILWFIVIAVLGLSAVISRPAVLAALNPLYALGFIAEHGWQSFAVMGSIFLAVTGAEVLYADLGHFGRRPIRTAWFGLIFPALILNYLGQGACVLASPDKVENLFYRLAPDWALYPLVILATAATIIASQAVISGAFSLARQSVQLGFWPRMRVRHTSDETIGQVYVPFVNWFLMAGTIGLALVFRKSGNLAGAYGLAVSIDMLITTGLIIYVAWRIWRVPPALLVPFGILFALIDGSFFLSNAAKILTGGWIVALFAVLICLLMKTWIDGRKHFLIKLRAALGLNEFVESLKVTPPLRVPGTAIYLTGYSQGVPKALLQNLMHNRVLHELTLVVSVQNLDIPRAAEAERLSLRDLSNGLWQAVIRYGFSETPDVPLALAGAAIPGFSPADMHTTYFVNYETLILTAKNGRMRAWRKRLFNFMFRNALRPTDYFRLPPELVVEIGSKTGF